MSSVIKAQALNALVYHLAAEAAEALARRGIRVVLLKGPPLSRWLGDPSRTSEDVDLLVSAPHLVEAERVLMTLGYRMLLPRERVDLHATTWVRDGQLLPVDLHTSVIGVGCRPERFWDFLEGEAITDLPHSRLLTPGPVAPLLLLALHAAQHGAGEISTLQDLEHALAITNEQDWAEASSVATQLDAADAFNVGLRLVPQGREVANRLGLSSASSPATLLFSSTPPHTAIAIERLSRARWIQRPRLTLRILFPSRRFMRDWMPVARRGLAGLIFAYSYRSLWLVWWSPRGYVAWRRAKRIADASRRRRD